MTTESTADVLTEVDVKVRMRDGISLATDIYRPTGNGRCPALLCRTPYDKRGTGSDSLLDRFDAVRRGYAVVIQDMRGRYRSEGEFVPFLAHEADDGFETVEWIARQPWCDGNVGVFGASAMGVTAIQAAVAGPSHLRAAMIFSGGANLHNGWIYSNGVLELGFALHWQIGSLRIADAIDRFEMTEARRRQIRLSLEQSQRERQKIIRALPLNRIAGLEEDAAPQWHEWLAHPGYDEYWSAIDAVRRASELKVPLLHLTGWYDCFLTGHIDLQLALQAVDKKRSHRLVIGPWEHFSHRKATAVIGERDFGPAATGGSGVMRRTLYEWFDHWLRPGPGGESQRGRVTYFVMGANTWRDADTWPPIHTDVPLYFHSLGHANTRTGDGTLSAQLPGDEPPDTFVYDPANPVPSVGGRTMHEEWGPSGVFDQADVELRDDVLVYTSAPLEEPMEIAGAVSVVLFADTSADDTDFTAKLVDLEPHGYCANLAEGVVRARYRNGPHGPEWIAPNTVERYVIDLGHAAHVFGKGHSVRVEVSSSNFPRFDRNLNARVTPALGRPEDVRVATQHVQHSREYPSQLRLPSAGDRHVPA